MNTLYLVRHGENTANLTKELSHRRVDYSLTAKGILQAQQTAAQFVGRGIDEIYASPLKRAVETAQIIAQALGLPFSVLEALREVNVGAMEGQPVSQALWTAHNRIIHAWFSGDSAARFPEGESHDELVERFTGCLRPVLQRGDGRRILLVGHGGTFLLALPTLCPGLQFADVLQQDNANCSISELEMPFTEGPLTGRLVQWASAAHLSGYAAEVVSAVPAPGELK